MWTPNRHSAYYGPSHQHAAPEPDYKAISDYYATELSVAQAEVARLSEANQALSQNNAGLHRENASLTATVKKERESYKRAVKQGQSEAAKARNIEASLRSQIEFLRQANQNYKHQLDNEQETTKAKEELRKVVSKLAKAEIKEASLRKHKHKLEDQIKRLKMKLEASKESTVDGLDEKLARDLSSKLGREDTDETVEGLPDQPEEYDTDIETTAAQPDGAIVVKRKFQGPTLGTLLAIMEALETEAKAHKDTKQKPKEAEATIELQKIPVALAAAMRRRFIYKQSDLPMDDKALDAIEDGNSGGHDGKWTVDVALCKLGYFDEDFIDGLQQIYKKDNIKKCLESDDDLKFCLKNPTWSKSFNMKASMRLLLDFQPHGDASIHFNELKHDCNLILGDLRQAYADPEDANQAFERSEIVKSKVEQMVLIVKDRLKHEGKIRRRRYRSQ